MEDDGSPRFGGSFTRLVAFHVVLEKDLVLCRRVFLLVNVDTVRIILFLFDIEQTSNGPRLDGPEPFFLDESLYFLWLRQLFVSHFFCGTSFVAFRRKELGEGVEVGEDRRSRTKL